MLFRHFLFVWTCEICKLHIHFQIYLQSVVPLVKAEKSVSREFLVKHSSQNDPVIPNQIPSDYLVECQNQHYLHPLSNLIFTTKKQSFKGVIMTFLYLSLSYEIIDRSTFQMFGKVTCPLSNVRGCSLCYVFHSLFLYRAVRMKLLSDMSSRTYWAQNGPVEQLKVKCKWIFNTAKNDSLTK